MTSHPNTHSVLVTKWECYTAYRRGLARNLAMAYLSRKQVQREHVLSAVGTKLEELILSTKGEQVAILCLND